MTTRDIDVIASRIAVKYLLLNGWEVADLNNLVPFSSIYCVSADIIERYTQKGPMKFLKEELSRKDPRVLFFRESGGTTYGRFQFKMRYAEIPKELAKLILTTLNTKNKYVPLDYLIFKSGEYVFIELKANNSQLTKRQAEVVKIILKEGYSVSVLRVSLSIKKDAKIINVPLVLS